MRSCPLSRSARELDFGSTKSAIRRLPATTYPDLDTFRRAYFQARVEVMNFELV